MKVTMQRFFAAACLSVAFGLQTPALAQVPNPGPDWELVSQRQVKVFVVHPTKPGDGKWELSEYNLYRLFQEDLENPIPTKPGDPAADVLLGAVKKGKPYDVKGEINRLRQGLLIHKYQTVTNVTPQTQEETTVHKGLKLSEFSRQETRSRALRTKYGLFDISFQIPIKNYRWDVVETHRTKRDLDLDPLLATRTVELLPPDRASEISAIAPANKDRPSSFQGDSGSGGNKSGLVAGQLRSKLGANEVKSSVAMTPEEVEKEKERAEKEAQKRLEQELKDQAKAEEERKKALEEQAKNNQNPPKEGEQRPLAMGDVLGSWTSPGGKSGLAITPVGNSKNMKVAAQIVLGSETINKTFDVVPFGEDFQVELGKDRLGSKILMKGTFNGDGSEMTVKIWLDGKADAPLGATTFTKR